MLRERLLAKLDSLGQEASDLTEFRQELIGRLHEVDTRLTQLVGAIAELKMVLDETDEPADDQADPEASSLPPL